MKTSKLLGLTLILSSLFLQVGYATTTTMETVSQTSHFDMGLLSPEVQEVSEEVEVKVIEDSKGKVINIQVNNLYPGAKFHIKSAIQNRGSVAGTITDVEFKQTGDITPETTKLFNALKGYDEKGEVYEHAQAYEAYFIENYEGKEIEPNETLDLNFALMLDEHVEDIEGLDTSFQLVFTFEQEYGQGGGEEKPEKPDTEKPDTEKPDTEKPDTEKPDTEKPDTEKPDTEKPDTEKPDADGDTSGSDTPDTDISDVEIPDGGASGSGIPDTEVPDGGASGSGIPDIEVPDSGATGTGTPDTDVPDSEKPDGQANLGSQLPQTGGVNPYIVYSIGLMMLGSGVMLYRKK